MAEMLLFYYLNLLRLSYFSIAFSKALPYYYIMHLSMYE